MKCNLDLVLSILQSLEGVEPNHPIGGLTDENYTQDIINYHIDLLINNGFVDGSNLRGIGDEDDIFNINGLTWKGHEFIRYAIKDDSIWTKGKEIAVSQTTSATIGWLLEWLKLQFS